MLKKVNSQQRKTKVPIIQTRAMKAKETTTLNYVESDQVTESDIDDFNKIDALTSTEIENGNQVIDDGDVPMGDGVDLSINGSDLETEFPEGGGSEAGEVLSDDDEQINMPCPRSNVRSKVVKVSKRTEINDKGDQDRFKRFKHLREDPKFKDFVNEILDDWEKHSRQQNKVVDRQRQPTARDHTPTSAKSGS